MSSDADNAQILRRGSGAGSLDSGPGIRDPGSEIRDGSLRVSAPSAASSFAEACASGGTRRERERITVGADKATCKADRPWQASQSNASLDLLVEVRRVPASVPRSLGVFTRHWGLGTSTSAKATVDRRVREQLVAPGLGKN